MFSEAWCLHTGHLPGYTITITMGDQPKINDFFDSNYDNKPDPDGAIPGSSGVTTRSQSIKSASDLIDAILESAESTLKTAQGKRVPKRLQNKSKKVIGKKIRQSSPTKNKKPNPKSKSTKLQSVTPEGPVGNVVLGTGTADVTSEGPVGKEGPAPGTTIRKRTAEGPVDRASVPSTEQLRAANEGTPISLEHMQVELEYLRQANIELKNENYKQKKKIKSLQNTVDELKKTSSRTRQMLKSQTKSSKSAPVPDQVSDKEHSNEPTETATANDRVMKKKKKVSWRNANIDITYSDTASLQTTNPSVMTVGSSLTSGTKEALRRKGVDAIELSYSGAQLPYIRHEMKKKLEENPQVKTVVILGGGNDCEARHHIEDIKYEFDALVDEVKLTRGVETKIIISSIPQRKRAHYKTHLKIAELNTHNATFYAGSEYGVTYVDAAPRFGDQYVDRVHFNYYGLDHWASKISAAIKHVEGQSI